MARFTRTAGLTLAVALSAPLGATPAAAGHPRHRHHTCGQRAVRVAAEYRGVPYRSGGTSPRGFDCSGFARFVYGKLDKHIPRSSQEQYDAAHRVGRPRVGDLIFYHSGRGGSVYHVGIYAGHHRVWHSPRPGETVRKERIWTSNWTAGRF